MDWVLRTAIPDASLGYVISRGTRRKPGIYRIDLDYADDIAIVASTRENAETLLRNVERVANLVGLLINISKTKAIMIPSPPTPMAPISLQSGTIEWVTEFTYLGSIIPSAEADLCNRTRLGWIAFNRLSKLWESSLSNRTKVYLFMTTVVCILLYGCETRSLTSATRKSLWATT